MKLKALQGVKRSGDGHPFGPLCSVKSQLDQTLNADLRLHANVDGFDWRWPKARPEDIGCIQFMCFT